MTPLRPCLPPHPLCWNTLACICVEICSMHTCPLLPGSSSHRGRSGHVQPALASWEQVSIALEEATCLLWVWPSTTFPHFWVAGLGRGWGVWEEQSQWTLIPWNWNSGQPRLPQVLISRGWPKGLGQEGREDFRGQYHPLTEEEEVFKVKPTRGWVNKLWVCPRTPTPLLLCPHCVCASLLACFSVSPFAPSLPSSVLPGWAYWKGHQAGLNSNPCTTSWLCDLG